MLLIWHAYSDERPLEGNPSSSSLRRKFFFFFQKNFFFLFTLKEFSALTCENGIENFEILEVKISPIDVRHAQFVEVKKCTKKISRMNFDSLPMTSFSIHNTANVFLHQSSCLTSTDGNCNDDVDEEVEMLLNIFASPKLMNFIFICAL